MGTYIALLRKEKNSNFGVDFPDFPGCITSGKTLEEAYNRASEALRFHIKGMLEDGNRIPHPISLSEIMNDPTNVGATPFLVAVSDTRTKRVNITMPESDLEAIDAHARKLKMSRSAFLLEAARRSMSTENRASRKPSPSLGISGSSSAPEKLEEPATFLET
ncbi:MAG: type II toxin-antitoxin system HicB family antitoxin [Deltaproteobacteria bacterium]|nr:type II toxin-antitoxin system HicB family antitoxin [Deltaproteobacteria bacterium]